jgi:signal transduction histidine kinase
VKEWLRGLLIPDDDTLPPLAYWRERVLRATLLGSSVGGIVPLVPGVRYAAQAGHTVIVTVDLLAYFLVVALALRPTLPFNLRAGTLVLIPFVIAVVLLTDATSVAAGAAWLTAFPVLAALFFGLRAATAALLVQLGVVIGIAGAVTGGIVDWGGALAPYPEGPAVTWVLTGTNVLLLSTVLSLTGGVLLRGLEQTADREASARRALLQEVEERQALEARVRQSEKLEAMGTLAGGIAHDFNNLLVPILLRSREVMDRFPAGHEVRESLQDVVLSATRARDMVRRILTFSRGIGAVQAPTSIDEVVREVASLLRNTLPATIRLDVETGADGAHVLGAPSELHQVLMNLGTNSYHAMRAGGGVLGLRTRVEEGAGPDGRTVVLEVEDTGTGMSPEVLARIYEPFFTTRERGEGTGLGMPTTQRIVVELGGSLSIESEEGRGTRVEIVLPVVRGTAVDPPPAEEASAAHGLENGRSGSGLSTHREGASEGDPRPAPIRVALVDDEAVVLRATQALLARLGFQVTAFPVPEAALRHISDPANRVDLLLTDYIMPGMTGVELAEAVQKVRPGLPVLLSSGNLDEPMEERLVAAGITGVLPKPWESEELLSAVGEALG